MAAKKEAKKPAKAKAKVKAKAKKPTKDKEICFVIMPFGGWLDDYYGDIYRPAIEDAGLEPRRADDLYRPSTIVNDIWAYTKKARLILADLSGKNPNVFYELGLAHALGKPAILISESITDVPFDLRALRVLDYDKNDPNWGDVLGEKLKNAISEVLKSPAEAVLPAFLDTKGTTAKPAVGPHDLELIDLRQRIDLLEQTRGSDSAIGISRRNSDVSISASEARRLIARYLRAEMSEEWITKQLSRRGAPESWIKLEILEQKNKIAKVGPSSSADT